MGDVLDDMLRDRLVCGINEDSIQPHLLVEFTFTFQRALEISQGLAASSAKYIEKAVGGLVHEVRKDTVKKKSRAVECFRCNASNCKFKETVCHNYNKKGHFKKEVQGC